ncbi:rho GTPase-activating protein gacV-like [Cynara cardunculus var. scolymus]|uniref:rho GTPase-activating protein gacV-like n=1 Tax=Cynara cardunculus var. scolymus TaxID=59895 RepID=UPI000D62C940|nr:rho GTPase-activating protein gacV-like [Cynara cardunculus var. scolymus]
MEENPDETESKMNKNYEIDFGEDDQEEEEEEEDEEEEIEGVEGKQEQEREKAEFHAFSTSIQCSLEEQKLAMARAEPSISASALDDVRASIAALKAEPLTNAKLLEQ